MARTTRGPMMGPAMGFGLAGLVRRFWCSRLLLRRSVTAVILETAVREVDDLARYWVDNVLEVPVVLAIHEALLVHPPLLALREIMTRQPFGQSATITRSLVRIADLVVSLDGD